jgi:hypothetical protein
MTISTVGTTIPHGITLGTGTYADQLTVTAAGTITGINADAGILGEDAGITLTNAGRLQGYEGVYLFNGNGTVVNQSGGFISGGKYGIQSGNLFGGGPGQAPSAIFNAGTINGGADGIALYSGGNVTNTGSIHGGFIGVYIYGAATLFNSGTITGSNAHGAVEFRGHGDDRLILGASASFYGYVGGSSGFNTVELTSGSTAGTIANFNAEYKNFHNIVLDSGATWTIASNAAYDTFDLLGVTQANIVETEAGGAVTFTAGTGELVVENEPEAVFTLSSDGAGGTDITYIPGAVSTITTTLTSNLTFGHGNYNADLTVSNTGAIITPNSGYYALTGVIGGVTLTNFGSILAAGVGGVSLEAGGTVVNALGGVIEASGGRSGAVVIDGGLGQVTNAGTLSDVYNGVVLYAGGDVENTGTIIGTGNDGVYIAGGGTVFNDGIITGDVSVGFSGNAADRLILTPRAVLTGAAYGGSGSNVLELASAASAGFITDLDGKFRDFSNIVLDAGANWTIGSDALNDTFDLTGITQSNVSENFANGALSFTGGGDTLVLGNVQQAAFTLASDGAGGTDIVYVPGVISTITTTLTGPVTFGAGNYNADLTIANTGAVIPSAPVVAALEANANGVSLSNFGIIQAHGYGVYLTGSGTVVNAASGVIANGADGYRGIDIKGAALVENAGSILGSHFGVYLAAGGTVINTGKIQSRYVDAIDITGAATVENSGTIQGPVAVQFNGAQADRLIITPGAVFQGSVSGGSGTNTLELAAGAGTIGGIGTQFTGFSQAVVDLDADWVLTGANAIASMSGYGTVILGNAAALTVTAGISQDLTVDFAGVAGTLALSDVPQDLAVIDDFANGDTIDLLGVTATEVAFTSDDLIFKVGGINENLQITGRLSTSSFAFISDGHGGTEITDNIIETLTTTLNTGITLGSGQFLDRLFITPTGAVKTTGNNGIYSSDAAAHLINYGIVSGVNYAASFNSGGTILNAGTLTAHEAVRFVAGTGTLANSGVIKGSTDGVVLFDGGNVVNTGTIAGTTNAGVYLENGGTLTNSGTIIGGVDAVQFKGAFADRLIDDPGAVFNGTVAGGTGTNTLELGSAASTGTLTGLGIGFTGFNQITVDGGAHWLLEGANTLASNTTLKNAGNLTLSSTTLTGLASLVNNGVVTIDPSSMTVQNLGGTGVVTLGPASTLDVLGSIAATQTIAFAGTSTLALASPSLAAGPILNFNHTDVIDLSGISAALVSYGSSGLVFSVGGTAETLNIIGNLNTADFSFGSDQHSGTSITDDIPCFAAGTQLLGVDGPVAVEDVQVGDVLVTVRDGGALTGQVIWTGRRRIEFARHPEPELMRPVRICAGAIAPGVPERDLRVSPHHAIYLEGVLAEAIALVNGRTIYQERGGRAVTYHHIELAAHDVVLAEGCPAESFLDTGNRAMFEGDVMALHADFRSPRDAAFCAPFVREGEVLDALRARLGERGRFSEEKLRKRLL